MTGSLVFVHGTGVRLAAYELSFARVEEQLRLAAIDRTIVECGWGDPLGVTFEGKSLPDLPDAATVEQQAQELTRWSWLFDDPLAELEMLSIRSAMGTVHSAPGQMPRWMEQLERIKVYLPSDELLLLLRRSGVEDLWAGAFARVMGSQVVREAFRRSEEANELADVGIALSRAVIAQLHANALDQTRPLPSVALRDRLAERLCKDWECNVFALGSLLAGFGKRVGTKVVRRRRNMFNSVITGFVGDILLYQSRGEEIREFISAKIEKAKAPVTVLGHSLGGIACFDLLAMRPLPKVDRLVTIGSQAPYFYEIDALASIRWLDGLPDFFPPWLNIYDRNDFLSFVGQRLFPGKVDDQEVRLGAPFPEAHSAYLGSDDVWERVSQFIAA